LRQVVLASRSPQREAILDALGIEFEVVVPDTPEVSEGDPDQAVLENARRKADSIEAVDALVIGCDTEVALAGRLLGKPAGEQEARKYLQLLSGRSHEVLSGLVLLGPEANRVRKGVARSLVGFRALADRQIDAYLASGEWRDRAGGYAIQGLGSCLAERIEGDLSNVIGLPLGLLLELAPELAPG
jgi:septum formation protein